MTGLEAVEILRWNVFSTFRGTHFPSERVPGPAIGDGRDESSSMGKVGKD